MKPQLYANLSFFFLGANVSVLALAILGADVSWSGLLWLPYFALLAVGWFVRSVKHTFGGYTGDLAIVLGATLGVFARCDLANGWEVFMAVLWALLTAIMVALFFINTKAIALGLGNRPVRWDSRIL